MTFEQALTALKQGKKVRRISWNNKDIYYKYDKVKMAIFFYDGEYSLNYGFYNSELFADDWEICEENQTEKKRRIVGGLIYKVTSNFDEYEQALDKFKCRLEDLREAAEELNGIKLDINIDFD